VLTPETHRKLLKGKDKPRQPLVRLGVHTAAQGMVFGRNAFGVPENNILVAEFGVIVPEFKRDNDEQRKKKGLPSQENAPDGVKYNWPGFKVQQVDLSNGNVTDFIVNKDNLPASLNKTAGLERPLQLEWGPDGSLYIVDFGVIEFGDKGMNAHPFTGVIWKVTKQ
jgi:glucose/arabinose dehydrogenase